MKANISTSRTSLGNLFLTAVIVIFVTSPFNITAQHFSFDLYASDAAGNYDTVTIGYHPDATTLINSKLNEQNMIRNRVEPGLDVRITNAYGQRIRATVPYETKMKWLPYYCGSDEVGFDLAVYTDHWPVKVSWDQAMFSDSCHNASVISNVRINEVIMSSDEFELEFGEVQSVLITRNGLERYYNQSQQAHLGLLSGRFKRAIEHYIPLNYNSPLQKPGWNLIFNDDFNGIDLDSLKWNISKHDNDGTGDCDPLDRKNIPHNPANVSVSGGKLKIKISNDPYDGCDYSGGEIKTFGWDDQFVTFFRKGGYLEIKAKIPIEEGVGSAAWLWTGNGPKYSEIDLWETQGIKNSFSATYHWDYAIKGLDRAQSGRRIALKHLDTIWHPFGPAPYYAETDLSANFITYGLEWDDDKVTWYVNGKIVRNMHFNQGSRPYTGFPPEEELWLRLSAGGDLCLRPNNDFCFPDPAVLPRFLEVDYVRVYVREGDDVVVKISQHEICDQPEGLTVRVSHYPDASYQFTAPWITSYTPHVWGVYNMAWYLNTNGSQTPNQYAPLYLETSFPSGYTELDTFQIYIESGPLPPAGPIQFQPYNNTCMYRVMIKKTKPTDSYSWSINGGYSFSPGVDKVIGGIKYSSYGPVGGGMAYNYMIKAYNDCGIDLSYTAFAQAPFGNSQSGCMAKWTRRDEGTGESLPETVKLVKVFSITGKLIEEASIKDFNIENVQLRLSSGLYLLQYVLENGAIYLSRKLIITQ